MAGIYGYKLQPYYKLAISTTRYRAVHSGKCIYHSTYHIVTTLHFLTEDPACPGWIVYQFKALVHGPKVLDQAIISDKRDG